ncbi:unnamed protein product, partial [Thlaspi arvense]
MWSQLSYIVLFPVEFILSISLSYLYCNPWRKLKQNSCVLESALSTGLESCALI